MVDKRIGNSDQQIVFAVKFAEHLLTIHQYNYHLELSKLCSCFVFLSTSTRIVVLGLVVIRVIRFMIAS